jgi:hypothetical protein
MLLSFIILLTESAIGVTNSLDERRTSMTHTQRNDTNSASRPQTHWRKQSHTTFHLPHPAPKPLTRCPQHMPHSISHSVFARTSLTICDSLVMALSYLEPRRMMSPEELVASASPWFLDAETVWWRKFWMNS